MSTVKVSCPVKGCKFSGKIISVEFDHYMYHLARDHDRSDLVQLAFKIGIIQDPHGFHNYSYIIQQIARISKVRQV